MLKFAPYVLKSLWRNRTRTALTVSGAALALFVFCFVGAVQQGLADLTRGARAERSLIVFQANRFCPFTSRLPEDYARYRDRYRIGWEAARAERWARVRELGLVSGRLSDPERDVGPLEQIGIPRDLEVGERRDEVEIPGDPTHPSTPMGPVGLGQPPTPRPSFDGVSASAKIP